MTPDDPRHGEYSGWHQHRRDGEDPCDPCGDARRIYQRRRRKLRQMGRPAKVRLGDRAHGIIKKARALGLTYADMSAATGVSQSICWRLDNHGPDQLVYARTMVAVLAYRPVRLLTHVGMQRRIRALARRGFSCAAIAEHAGVHEESVSEAQRANIASTARVREAVAAAYEDLCMRPEPEGRGPSRVRNQALRRGWAAPLAWDDDTIDDPAASPACAAYDAAQRDRADVDEVVVQRILAGDRVSATVAERFIVTAQWLELGRDLKSLERTTGWKVDRYTPDKAQGQVAA